MGGAVFYAIKHASFKLALEILQKVEISLKKGESQAQFAEYLIEIIIFAV